MNWNELFFDPLQDFFAAIIGFLPKLLAALLLLLLGWILAKVFKGLTIKLMKAIGIDKRMGKADQYPIAQGTGTTVYWIIWIFFILAILQVLGLQGVLTSIQVLFAKIFSAIPNILAAVIVLVLFYLIGRFLSTLITKILTKARFNELPVKLGIANQPSEGASSPSSMVGYLVLVFIMLFAITMAADLLGFEVFNGLIARFTEFLALVILGLVVIGLGLFISNLVANILRTGGRPESIVTLVRVSIIILAVAIGLRAMGFANDIILLIFGLMVGSIAVAAAIAFGIGGRKAAGQLLERWVKPKGTDNE